MLIQMLVQQPRMLGPVLQATPPWVWFLAAGLAALGLSQLRTREVTARRMAFVPVAMGLFSLWGLAGSFGHSPDFASAFALWAGCALLALGAMLALGAPAGARYDAAGGRFRLPGSVWPLLLIAAIFLVKYVVGVELAMRPALALDTDYLMGVAALYGLFSGLFAGRSARLWRLTAPATGLLQRDPW
ncbi:MULTISPECIES: DUF6622 family protein [Ramlibacter]|uniref:DUF1453 domain-containing protein n=1 Tax=Ramlibacter aquaticus TaxID=2780094 RepID=A0ABR9SA67_9BURK|nr:MULTISPECIES: DUF6622 family protein [Ramlibacter]MBE7938977.1 hypothetical protein [Ramlibacter aquaticus]